MSTGAFIGKILGGSLGEAVSSIGNTVRKFVTTDSDRMQMQAELERILQKRDSEVEQTIRSELEAKSKIIEAELNQKDNYTKRARPTVVYFGLVIICFNYCIVPSIQSVKGIPLEVFALPTEFWVAWGGIVSTWVVGRSAEKRGERNKVTSFITGSDDKSIL